MGEKKPPTALDVPDQQAREEQLERRVDAVKNSGNVIIDVLGVPLLIGLGVPPEAVGGMTSGMKAALTFTVGAYGRKAKRNLAQLMAGLVSVAPEGTTAEEVVEQIRKSTEEDPELEDDVYDLIQRALAGIDGAVVPALGRLLYHHTRGSLCAPGGARTPRRVFRGTARLLCELDGE